MIERFLKTYKDGFEVYLNPSEKDQIIEEIEKLKKQNKMLKEAVKEKVIATCNACEDYGICPHSYREFDLDNIINELNYGIKELDDMFYETFRISQNGYYSISEWELKEFTDKIKELKEGVKK